KAVRDLISISKAAEASDEDFRKDPESMDAKELNKLAKELEKKMRQAAAELNFEEAAKLRDRMKEVKVMLLEIENS
ncbi:MAG: UvrB/UvrC motif-containing protein, partial [Lachnospiraceae bacterium]|nr:UvrB/UvrC motif-containing protein [Lachnospiraceae bacterium]